MVAYTLFHLSSSSPEVELLYEKEVDTLVTHLEAFTALNMSHPSTSSSSSSSSSLPPPQKEDTSSGGGSTMSPIPSTAHKTTKHAKSKSSKAK